MLGGGISGVCVVVRSPSFARADTKGPQLAGTARLLSECGQVRVPLTVK